MLFGETLTAEMTAFAAPRSTLSPISWMGQPSVRPMANAASV